MKDAIRLYAPLAAVCLLLGGASTSGFGCTSGDDRQSTQDAVASAATPASSPADAEQDSVFAYLDRIDQEPLRGSFVGLEERTFTRYMRAEQFDADGYLVAYEERVLRHGGPPSNRRYVEIARDSAGVFDFGYLGRFITRTDDVGEPVDLMRYVLPEDPAYLSARNRDAFAYSSLPDTLLWNTPIRVIEVRALPETGDGQNIRRVRLFVNRSNNRLFGVYLERIDRGIWYREESQLYVQVRPAADGSLVPHTTRFESKIALPFRPSQRFRSVSTYYDFNSERSDSRRGETSMLSGSR